MLKHLGLAVACGALLLPATQAAPELPSSPVEDAYNLLANPGLEAYDPPYGHYRGMACQVASGWQPFWYTYPKPCWMDTRVFAAGGFVEHIEGDTAQLLVSTEPYVAGLWQRAGGLTPGVGYGFHAAMLSIFQTSAQPPMNGMMIKQVGIDPTGGTDPLASTILWSEPQALDQQWALDLRVSLYAQTPVMTVFIRAISPYPSGDPSFLNLSFLDSAILAQTPMISAVSPPVSEDTSFVVNWDNAEPAPGLKKLKMRDVQWMDEAEGVWHDWLTRYADEAQYAMFSGERGHAYRFRARVWQKYANGALLASPYRPAGDTRTWIRGPVLSGQVLNHHGFPIQGTTVTVVGTEYTTRSASGGRYEIGLAPVPDPHAVTVQDPYWLAPAPVYDVVFGPTDSVELTWTLRPPDDAVTNGEFEAGLGGWQTLGQAPAVVSSPVHTGHGALGLGGAGGPDFTSGILQTAEIADAWDPALSFWYNPAGTLSGDRLEVEVTIVVEKNGAGRPEALTQVFTPMLDRPGWTHIAYYLGPPDTPLSGTVTTRFQFWHLDTTPGWIYLDEISLGATLGGPHKVYLPAVFREP